MVMFQDWLTYIFARLQDLVDLIFSNWLLSVMFGIQILLFVISSFNANRDRMDRKER